MSSPFSFIQHVDLLLQKTLFILPLRVIDGTNNPIIPDYWSTERLNVEILEPFKKVAGECLLFTHIHTIGCVTREADNGVVTPHWSFRAQKNEITGLETGYVVTNIEITNSADSKAQWTTVTTFCTRD